LKEENGKWFIRANQGHSIEVKDLELTPIKDASKYPIVVHGTYHDAWQKIKVSGLNKMSRTHIHMAIGEFGSANVISGMRRSCEVLVYVDIAKAMDDGIEFFQSANGVILTAGDNGVLSTKYFKHVLQAPSLQPFDKDYPLPRDPSWGSVEKRAAPTEKKERSKKKPQAKKPEAQVKQPIKEPEFTVEEPSI
jgi:2'-phosphotransferase